VTTTQEPVDHIAEARRLLNLVSTEAIGALDNAEYTAVYGQDPRAVAAVASAHIALAQCEEQRTGNILAAYTGDLIRNPHPVGTREHDAWWNDVTEPITERLGLA
jgi:hypothetical protein